MLFPTKFQSSVHTLFKLLTLYLNPQITVIYVYTATNIFFGGAHDIKNVEILRQKRRYIKYGVISTFAVL